MRTSTDQFNKHGQLINGYDYKKQMWVIDGVIQNCGHPEDMDCGCYGREHAGELTNLLTPAVSDSLMKEQELEKWQEQSRKECVEIGEHFLRTISENGDDVCFNCGLNY